MYLFAGGEAAEVKFGQSPASGGDINGDGTTDIVIASSLFAGVTHSYVGRVYVFLTPPYSSVGWPTSENKHWSAADANIIIDGPDNDNFVLFGYALACNGNTNKGTGEGQDARADILIGAPRADTCSYNPPQLRNDRGFVYLFRCTGTVAAGPSGDQVSWTAGDYAAYYRIKCLAGTYDNESPYLGRSVMFLGDVDGDAESDDEVMFGAPGWDTSYYGSGIPADDWGCVYLVCY
ncbi:MAG: FG-GAP repeat protein [Phycisphaerales bacterium]|nr:FG-GAP repeat protein [Phycisphaerales bacterium]